jgi:hypothetical protein
MYCRYSMYIHGSVLETSFRGDVWRTVSICIRVWFIYCDPRDYSFPIKGIMPRVDPGRLSISVKGWECLTVAVHTVIITASYEFKGHLALGLGSKLQYPSRETFAAVATNDNSRNPVCLHLRIQLKNLFSTPHSHRNKRYRCLRSWRFLGWKVGCPRSI